MYPNKGEIMKPVSVMWTTKVRKCIVCGWDTLTAARKGPDLVGLCKDLPCQTSKFQEM